MIVSVSPHLSSMVPKCYPYPAGCLHEIQIEWHLFRLVHDLGERHGNQMRWSVRHHHPELFVLNEFEGLSAKSCRQDPVKTRGSPASLEMPQHDRP